jgi:hypothetical protein
MSDALLPELTAEVMRAVGSCYDAQDELLAARRELAGSQARGNAYPEIGEALGRVGTAIGHLNGLALSLGKVLGRCSREEGA